MSFCNDFETLDDKCCQGPGACNFSQLAGRFSICKGSCNGASACNFGSSGGTSAVVSSIGKYSCRGFFACDDVGARSESVSIGDNSCTGMAACSAAGYTLFTSESVSIGDNSCTENHACGSAGAHSKSFYVGDTSCTGENACEYVGNFGLGCQGPSEGEQKSLEGGRVTIGDNSCWGNWSCTGLGDACSSGYIASEYPKRERVSVGNNSCRGEDSCHELGKYRAGSVTVGEFKEDATATCDGAYSCDSCDCAVAGQSLTVPEGTPKCDTSQFCPASKMS